MSVSPRRRVRPHGSSDLGSRHPRAGGRHRRDGDPDVGDQQDGGRDDGGRADVETVVVLGQQRTDRQHVEHVWIGCGTRVVREGW